MWVCTVNLPVVTWRRLCTETGGRRCQRSAGQGSLELQLCRKWTAGLNEKWVTCEAIGDSTRFQQAMGLLIWKKKSLLKYPCFVLISLRGLVI